MKGNLVSEIVQYQRTKR